MNCVETAIERVAGARHWATSTQQLDVLGELRQRSVLLSTWCTGQPSVRTQRRQPRQCFG